VKGGITFLSRRKTACGETVIELFARSGRSPRLHEIGEETGLPPENLRTLVAQLQAHDLLGMNPSADSVLYAYPFTGERTEHRVQLSAASSTPSAPLMRSALPGCFERMSS
jgi:DNA-binding IclR family transcriptional regulator